MIHTEVERVINNGMEGYRFVDQEVVCLWKQEEILDKVKVDRKKRADMTSRIGQLRSFTPW